MRLFLLSLFLLASCGPAKQQSRSSASEEKIHRLEQKRDLYRTLLPSQQGASGFIETDKCDALLFSSLLAGGSSGNQIQVQEAEKSPGLWYRRPASLPECFANKESQSTISRDQLLGVMWYSFRTGRIDLIRNLWEYGQSHSWIMGKDSIGGSHTLFQPLLPLLARIRYVMEKGAWDSIYRTLPLPSSFDSGKIGFEAHLQVLQLKLDQQAGNPAGDGRLQEQAAREPKNPLFQWAVGNLEAAVDSLLEEPLWPSDRLPTSRDRCPAWLLERDSQEWIPCDNIDNEHSGGDFLFVTDLILEGIKQ